MLRKVTNRYVCTIVGWALVFGATLPAIAQSGAGEVRGKVTDSDGNPLPGVEITFSSTVNETAVYTTTTNKKGRYLLPGLVYFNTGKWKISTSADGFTPTKVHIESRTQTALIDKFDAQLKPGAAFPLLNLRPFGKGVVDIVMTPADQVAQAVQAETEAQVAQARELQRQKDPWAAATGLAAAGQLNESLPLFEKAIAEDDSNVERRIAYAKVLYQTEDYANAMRQAMQAAEQEPQSLDAHMVLYSVQVATNNYAGAKLALDAAREVAPEDLRVLRQMAFLAEQTDDSEGSIGAYEKIAELKPDDAEAWIALGGLYARTGRMGDSERAYQKVVELNPDTAHQAFYNLGVLLMNKKNLSQADTRRAAEAFAKAIEIKPDYAPAHQQRAFALLGLGDISGAVGELELYLKYEPKAKDAADMKAMIEGLRR